jgi:hypothetical protein
MEGSVLQGVGQNVPNRISFRFIIDLTGKTARILPQIGKIWNAGGCLFRLPLLCSAHGFPSKNSVAGAVPAKRNSFAPANCA